MQLINRDGVSDDELVEILLGKDSSVREVWLNNYAQDKGFDNYTQYRDFIAKQRGFTDWGAYKGVCRKKDKVMKINPLISKTEAMAVLKSKERILATYKE